MDNEYLMNKQRLTEALARFDPITREHGLGEQAEYMLNIPQAITIAIMVIFRDQIPEDDDTRVIREAMGKLYYRFEEDLQEGQNV
ncbi:hypothetical protein LCGC14_1728100 [marine sediment metagenome]|uniref:Uncharacterized protein n=1 Tax=marine sediment metagenome TaxID=412755 RepID=A0A0F9KA19_9ZZZZ